MLVIRFQRVGRRNDPAFRIVVTEKRSKPKSGELEILGSFHPKTKEIRLKAERILHWLSQGAQASPRVHNLLVSRGVIKGRKIPVAPRALPHATSAPEPAPARPPPVQAREAHPIESGGQPLSPPPEKLPEAPEEVAPAAGVDGGGAKP